jgi:hypothetical protein
LSIYLEIKKIIREIISCLPHLRLAVDLGEVLQMLGIVLRCLAVQGEVLRYLAMQLGEVLKCIDVYFRIYNFLPMSGQFNPCWIESFFYFHWKLQKSSKKLTDF